MRPTFRDLTPPPRARTGRDRYAPGCQEAKVAAFRSRVTDAIGDAVGLPVAVIAVTDDTEGLARHLTEEWHAAWSASPSGHATAFSHAPFTSADVTYAASPLEARWLRGTQLPPGVRLAGGALRVTLPAGAVADDLGTLFEVAMYDLRFDVLAGRPAHVVRRHASGRPVHAAPRYSGRPGAPLRSFTLVRDLYGFRPRDLPEVAMALALATEGVAVRHELAQLRSPMVQAGDVGR